MHTHVHTQTVAFLLLLCHFLILSLQPNTFSNLPKSFLYFSFFFYNKPFLKEYQSKDPEYSDRCCVLELNRETDLVSECAALCCSVVLWWLEPMLVLRCCLSCFTLRKSGSRSCKSELVCITVSVTHTHALMHTYTHTHTPLAPVDCVGVWIHVLWFSGPF